MAIVGDAEGELSRLWSLVCELSEQLNNNKAATASLQAQANALKVIISYLYPKSECQLGSTDYRDKQYTMELALRYGGLIPT
jgi:hypothetical protein